MKSTSRAARCSSVQLVLAIHAFIVRAFVGSLTGEGLPA